MISYMFLSLGQCCPECGGLMNYWSGVCDRGSDDEELNIYECTGCGVTLTPEEITREDG